MRNLPLLFLLFVFFANAQRDYVKFDCWTVGGAKIFGIASSEEEVLQIVTDFNNRNDGNKFKLSEVRTQWVMSETIYEDDITYFKSKSGGKNYIVLTQATTIAYSRIDDLGLDEASRELVRLNDLTVGVKVSAKHAFNILYLLYQVYPMYSIDNQGIIQTSLTYKAVK